MALEQQHNQITDKINQHVNLRDKTQRSFSSQLELIPTDGSMSVSFYYIPHMSSHVEVQRVRKSLLPFVELLVEHSVDLEARHLTLYHHLPIDEVTVALQRLNLGAELQQTMTHYEPLEMVTPKQEPSNSWNQKSESMDTQFSFIQQFLHSVLDRLKQWIEILKSKKDQ